MTPAERLIRQMRDQRKRWVTLQEAVGPIAAKRVQTIRPPETELADFIATTEEGRFTLQAERRHVEKYVIGWEGFTEADLVGAAGSSDAVEFTPGLWAEVVADKSAWLRLVAQALLDQILEHREARAEVVKN